MEDQKPSVSRLAKEEKPLSESFKRSNSSFLFRQDSYCSFNDSNNHHDPLSETPKRQKLDDLANNSILNLSGADSVPGSPWEWRKMKAELISLRTRLNHQEDTVEHLHKVRQEMEEVFQKEKNLLQIQIDQDKSTIKHLELRIELGKKSLQDAKAAQAKAERDLIQMKSQMEQKILALVNDNNKITEELRNCIKKEAKETKPIIEVLKTENKIKDLEEKCLMSNKRIADLEEKLKEAKSYQEKFELQSVELQGLKVRLENLQTEQSIFEDNKKFSARAAKAKELEEELRHAREINASLRESVKGKLLLEEQIAHLENRLKRTESLEKQVSQLEFSQAELLAKLSDYEEIGIAGGPIAVKREIKRLQTSLLELTAEEGELRTKIDLLDRELASTKVQLEETKKQLTDSTNSHERLSRFVTRLQKKMSLVTRERDSYRQQLDSYEKEITSLQNNENPPAMNERIPALERTIESYRELVAKLESDIEALDGSAHLQEFKKLKEENEKLKDEIAHRALKGDFNINTRILHYKMNPAAIAEKQAEEKQKALLEEVERLRAIVSSGNHTTDNVPVSSLQAQEIAELQQKHEIKISRLKEAFKISSHEYRQACYQLFGWRVDRTKEGQYKLSSQYAESPDDYLFFIVSENDVNMIETPFSATLDHFIERHLKKQHSVPMFLNAVQSDLFDQQTVIN